jgi:hypothetical protein
MALHYTQQQRKLACQIYRVDYRQLILCVEVEMIGCLTALRAKPILLRCKRAD